jgi:light-regulated signal transduction histidine kinase (bacteriophytochrome)
VGNNPIWSQVGGRDLQQEKNGELFWIAQSISPVLDENGEISHFVGVSMDMTQRKKDAEQLKSYAIELQRNNKELEDFAFIASHDLQEPLRKITTFGDRLIEKTVDLDEHSRDYIERMGKSARRMKRFIEDLLLYSKVTTKQKPFELVDLEKKVKTVCEEMDHIIHSTHAVVNISNLPTIEGDNNQIHQLIVNLIFNSFKYKSEGKPPIINIFGKKKENNYWEISIQDNGIGFDEKYADRIFKPFQRLHGRSKYEGSGLGLTICKKIVERHNGTISALSKPGVGTTFILTLPEKQPPIH